MTFNLIKHEFMDFLKQPPLWMLVILPIIMSVLIIGLMIETGQELMLLPSWILFAQVMVGIMIIAPGFIEEKEQKTLDALLISPLTLRQVITAKCTTILIFSLASQLLVYTLNIGFTKELWTILPFMIVGGILFIQVGLTLGLLMNSSKTAAAISSVVMVVLFITATFYQQLPEWKYILQFIPSLVVTENIHGIFNEQFSLYKTGLLILWVGLLYFIINYLVNRALNK